MVEVVFAGALLLLTHLGVSSGPLRQTLTGRIGESPYLGLYSLVAVATFAYLIWVYANVPRLQYLWTPNPDLYWVPKLVMPFVFMLLAGGFLVKNPTTVGFESALGDEGIAQGVLRITRHPFQWSVIIWALVHIVANGDYVSIVFFATFALLSGVGGMLIDRKKANKQPDDWAKYSAVTSNVPFAAIARGRNRLVIGELWLPIAVGAVLYAIVFYLHEWVSGVPVFL